VDKVDEQALDVRAVVVLVRHDQQVPVSQLLDVRVLHAVPQPQDLADVLDLLVLHDLGVGGLAHVERLALEREHAVVVAPHDGEPRHGERFGAVALRQNQSAVLSLGTASVVRIVELCDPGEFDLF